MKLKEALTLRKPEHVKQEKNKSGIMTLGKALELRKAKKYIKRTGSPGNYKYYYKDEAGKLLAPGAKEQVSGRIMRQKEKKPVSSKKYMKEHAGDIRREADELKRMSEKDFKRKKEESDKKKPKDYKEVLAERTAKKKKAGKKKKIDYSDAPEAKLSARAKKIQRDVFDGKITMAEARKKIGIKKSD